MTSMRHRDRRGTEPSEADPYYPVNRDMSLNRSLEPLEHLHSQANTNYLRGNTEAPLSRTVSEIPVSQNDPSIEVDLEYYRPLYQAALNGDWQSANRFFQNDPNAPTAKISIYSMTALHVAATVGCSEFIEKLVERLPTEALAMLDSWGNTALHYAAASGSTGAVKAMVKKNPSLTQIMDIDEKTPIFYAALWGRKNVLWYLSLVTTDDPPSRPFTGSMATSLICSITSAGFHDVVLYLLQRYPNLATIREDENTLLRVLARKPSEFRSGSRFGLWGRCIYQFVPVDLNTAPPRFLQGDIEDPPENSGETIIQPGTCLTQVLYWFNRLLWKSIENLVPIIKQVHNEKLRHKQAAELVKHVCKQLSKINNKELVQFFMETAILNVATRFGIVEIVQVCLQFFPDLIWLPINKRTIIHVAVENRREKIFNLVRKKTARNMSITFMTVESENNILHLAAKLPPSPQLKSVSGSALQIQRELQWFKEVEKSVYTYKDSRNDKNQTPWELFMEEHKVLVENGERWMKDTSNSCMLVTTLIATVVFAGIFTVPGGNNNNDGIPIFSKSHSFMVFAVSDALALFSASTSLLTFLSILTSHYAEEDFLESLPKRLIIGLASLFFAIATMMIAFSAALSIVLNDTLKWASIPIAAVACCPVTLFAMLQLPLFLQMVESTYGSGIFRHSKVIL